MSLFDTSGGKAVKFEQPGATITGTVKTAPYEKQQTKYGTSEPDYWPNGDPKMQVLVHLATDQRVDADDDGDRTLYVSSSRMKRAIGEAMRNAGAKDIEVGGSLTVTYTGPDPASKNPANPAKLYTASYMPPASPLAQQATAPAQPAAPAPQPVAQQEPINPWNPPQPPAQAAPAAPQQASGNYYDKVKQLINMAMTDDQIHAATSVPIEQIAAIRAAA